MQVQITSDSTISMHNKLSDSIGAYVINVLRRFDTHLTRVEVHLTGEANTNGTDGSRDKRCVLEARPRHHRPLIASAKATDIDSAFAGAAEKLHRLLNSTYARLDDKRRRKDQMATRTAPGRQLAAS